MLYIIYYLFLTYSYYLLLTLLLIILISSIYPETVFLIIFEIFDKYVPNPQG